jgi:hypothetical protein
MELCHHQVNIEFHHLLQFNLIQELQVRFEQQVIFHLTDFILKSNEWECIGTTLHLKIIKIFCSINDFFENYKEICLE